MMWGQLPFTSEDVTLIDAGLVKRAGQTVASREPGARVRAARKSVEVAAQ
jgi:hypothetical protein